MSPKNPEPATPDKGRGSAPRPARGGDAESAELSTGLRTLITFLIIVHGFFVLSAVAANYSPVSPLRARLSNLFLRVYPQALNQYLAYNFHLTYDTFDDTDHELFIEAPPAEGQAEPLVIRLPQPDLSPGIRRRRYQLLALRLAQSSDDDVIGALLPRAIGARVMTENGIERVSLVCRAHLVQNMEDVEAEDERRRDPHDAQYFRPLYQARVWRDGDTIELYKVEDRGDTAPVANPSAPAEGGLPERFPGAP